MECVGAMEETYINEFGFFFFFRIAVAVSSACDEVSGCSGWGGGATVAGKQVHTSLCSAPEGSLFGGQQLEEKHHQEGTARRRCTYLERSTFGFVWSGSADMVSGRVGRRRVGIQERQKLSKEGFGGVKRAVVGEGKGKLGRGGLK